MIRLGVIGLTLVAGLQGHSAGAAETLGDALLESKLSVNVRVRYEGVEQGGFAESAEAVTGRMRAGVQTGQLGGTSLLAEAVLVKDLVDDYNSTTNGKSAYPVVADPADFVAINRFAFVNNSLDKTTFTVGRQRIVLDDSRFVGNVGWRQHEQTYDAVRAQFNGAVKVDFSYAEQVNRIFGPDSPAGRWNGDVFLGNVSKEFGFGTLTAFDYMLDLETAPALSTNTIGLRLTGSQPLGGLTANYTVSFATQSDTGNNPVEFSENYYQIEGGLGLGKFAVALGYEALGSDGVTAVTTPLATLHAFQGWADKFLGTPAQGIDDSYARLGYRIGKVGPFTGLAVTGVYHNFDASRGAAHYGDEIDLQLVARTARLAFTLKYAAFDADSIATDTDKYWLSVDYAF
jgi:hypothetical protein